MVKSKRAYLALSIFMVTGIVLSGSVYADPETRTTSTGAVFTRVTDHPALGEAWSDPTGLIWGDIVKNTDGTIHRMTQYTAIRYCTSIGAHLPAREDFIWLRQYMGAGTYEGYSPQVLPNLASYWFWSWSVYPSNPDEASYFYGFNGFVGQQYRNSYGSVRCVASR